MNSRLLRTAGAVALFVPMAVGLSGCDPDPIQPAGTALTITPSLGMVRNATVQVRNSSNAVVGNGETSSTGVATVTATGSGPFIIEVLGDPDAEYFDESTGTFLPFRSPDVLRAIVPTGTTSVGVTGLTDMAHALWAANSVPLSNANINAANGAILNTLGSVPVLTSILTPPNPLSSTTAGSLTNTAADAYAAILAGIADMGSTAAAPALDAIKQLRRDVADGVLDGNEGSTPIAGLLYSGGFATTFQNRVDNRINTLGNTALAATTFTVNALTVPTWTTSSGGGGSTIPATVNSNLVGTYNMVFCEAQSGAPFANGTQLQVSIAAGGVLYMPGKQLGSPFNRIYGGSTHLPEIHWLDGNFDYALSDNQTGTFNEINVGNAASLNPYPAFLGQLREGTSCTAGTPTITSFTTSGAVGDNVIINGSGFGSDLFHVVVKFANNIAATVTSTSDDEINVTVPAGAVDGRITVIINGGTPVLTTSNFDVTASTGSGGDAWVARASATSALTNGIAFGNNTFVTVGALNTVQTSSDGLAWTTATLSTEFKNGWFSGNSVTFDGTRFIMVGDSTNAPTFSPLIAISTDGVNWTRRNWIPMSTQYNLNDVTAANGTITAVGGDAIVSSTDGGDTWNNEEQPSTGALYDLRAVASNGSTRVIVGRSNNGILVNSGTGWTSAASGLTDFCPSDVIWSGEFFLAVGGSDCNYGASAVVMQSQNGSNWTRYALDTTASPAGYDLRGAFMHSDGRVYAVGGDGQKGHVVVSSANGSTWTRELQGQVTAGQGHLKAIAGSSTRIVAVGGVSNATKP